MALTVTATGGLCLFAGVIVLGHIVGSYDLDVVLISGNQIRAHPYFWNANFHFNPYLMPLSQFATRLNDKTRTIIL